ncbi:hypothetical protein Slin15195_G112910 [Septoria linicola]|uniref:Uncharacterized protein n=1 Tax=Septoria linicola TaxID=215465 RepID=A0A9Q9B5Y6_9PEZI|nr:hypothetical protein Slin15195_G112910 [Septoria linicola]
MAATQQARFISDPPMRIHKATQITQKAAQPLLAKFLERTKTKPHLHPDAWLATEGVRWGPKGGPNGGWAIHHLKRIESGLQGVSLMPESKEELVAKFGDEAIQHGITTSDPNHIGDEEVLDNAIQQTESHYVEDSIDLSGKSGKDLTAAEKKARKDAKKKRSLQEQNDGERAKKRKKQDAGEDTATTSGAMDLDNDPDAQSKESYEQEQEILEGEVGERDGAPSSKQNIPPPTLVTHDTTGEVSMSKKATTEEDKAARRAAKKAKRNEERAAKAKGSMPKDARAMLIVPKRKKGETAEERAMRKAAQKAVRQAEKNAARVVSIYAEHGIEYLGSRSFVRDGNGSILVPIKQAGETAEETAERKAAEKARLIPATCAWMLNRDEHGNLALPLKAADEEDVQRPARKQEMNLEPYVELCGWKCPTQWARPGRDPCPYGTAKLDFFVGRRVPKDKPPAQLIRDMEQVCLDCGVRDHGRYRRGLQDETTWVLICQDCYEPRRAKREKEKKEREAAKSRPHEFRVNAATVHGADFRGNGELIVEHGAGVALPCGVASSRAAGGTVRTATNNAQRDADRSAAQPEEGTSLVPQHGAADDALSGVGQHVSAPEHESAQELVAQKKRKAETPEQRTARKAAKKARRDAKQSAARADANKCMSLEHTLANDIPTAPASRPATLEQDTSREVVDPGSKKVQNVETSAIPSASRASRSAIAATDHAAPSGILERKRRPGDNERGRRMSEIGREQTDLERRRLSDDVSKLVPGEWEAAAMYTRSPW